MLNRTMGDDLRVDNEPNLSRRILVIDDHQDSADSFAMALTLEGYFVQCAYDAETALSIAREIEPDIAFLDIGMPYRNGFVIAEELQRMSKGRPKRLAAVTGYTKESYRDRARALGFDCYFVKPVDIEELKRWIATLALEAN